MERQVTSIWSELLHLERIHSTKTSFFALAANSLLLIRLHSLYQRQFQQKINISELFRLTTIADHVQLLEGSHVTIESPWESLMRLSEVQRPLPNCGSIWTNAFGS